MFPVTLSCNVPACNKNWGPIPLELIDPSSRVCCVNVTVRTPPLPLASKVRDRGSPGSPVQSPPVGIESGDSVEVTARPAKRIRVGFDAERIQMRETVAD